MLDIYKEPIALLKKQLETLPQALLLHGDTSCKLEDFIEYFLALIFCETSKPCWSCIICQQIKNKEHLDIHWVLAQKDIIKIQQITTLITQTTTKSLTKKFFIINADKLNVSAANAFLKILEEPPLKTHFILTTSDASNLLPTITSRCQKIVFNNKLPQAFDLGIFQDYQDLLAGKILVTALSLKWLKNDITFILRELYKIISCKVKALVVANCDCKNLLDTLTAINLAQKKIKAKLNINAQLALENILFKLTIGDNSNGDKL